MTNETPMPNVRAQAAADKAYQKATRPWFKKKRFIIPLALVLLAIMSSALNGGGKEQAAAPAPVPAATGTAPAPSADASVAPVAEAVPAPAAPAQPAAEMVQVQAAQLLADFKANEAAADLKYKGKALQVTGHVNKVDTEFLDKNQYVVRLDNGESYAFLTVNCNDISTEQAAAVVADSTITVSGMFQDGGDLGVELKGCKVL